jgi:thiol-disulfide isomerase/thioredoxin
MQQSHVKKIQPQVYTRENQRRNQCDEKILLAHQQSVNPYLTINNKPTVPNRPPDVRQGTQDYFQDQRVFHVPNENVSDLSQYPLNIQSKKNTCPDNIRKVKKERHLVEILNDDVNRIIIVLFCRPKCGPCESIKPWFIEFARDNPTVQCVYINVSLSTYEQQTQFINNRIQGYPTFMFYYKKILKLLTSSDPNEVLKTYAQCLTQIENEKKINDMSQSISQPLSQQLSQSQSQPQSQQQLSQLQLQQLSQSQLQQLSQSQPQLQQLSQSQPQQLSQSQPQLQQLSQPQPQQQSIPQPIPQPILQENQKDSITNQSDNGSESDDNDEDDQNTPSENDINNKISTQSQIQQVQPMQQMQPIIQPMLQQPITPQIIAQQQSQIINDYIFMSFNPAAYKCDRDQWFKMTDEQKKNIYNNHVRIMQAKFRNMDNMNYQNDRIKQIQLMNEQGKHEQQTNMAVQQTLAIQQQQFANMQNNVTRI